MSINFVFFWAVPIGGMGSIYKYGLRRFLFPVYQKYFESSPLFKQFAHTYIYTKSEYTLYFPMVVLLLFNTLISLSLMFYIQFTYGYLPPYVIFLYYCSWVGLGGRVMGGAYTMAHKEGHNHTLYKKWIRQYVGNVFENHIGVLFGNVPYNFSTSHVFIHHKLDGGPGDTFYLWDLDRTNWTEFMIYITRIFKHMIGYSSLRLFHHMNQRTKYNTLLQGMVIYWTIALVLWGMTQSFSFVFWIYIQPLFCMSYFLALLNYGFHGFLEFDEQGLNIPVVDATTIIHGDDDYFGEDDHMTHHYNSTIFYTNLPQYHQSKIPEFRKYKASVFKECSILEVSIFIVFNLWDELAKHYVDYTNSMSVEEIKVLLKDRCQRKQIPYERYIQYEVYPTMEARKVLLTDIQTYVRLEREGNPGKGKSE